jgi:C4-dicarboxylate transporter
VIGAYFVSVALGAVGIVLGVVGYALGARRLGAAAVVAGAASIFVGLLVGQGVMAGSYDRAVNGWFRDTPVEQITDEE